MDFIKSVLDATVDFTYKCPAAGQEVCPIRPQRFFPSAEVTG